MAIRIIGFPLSPFVRKCHVVAAEKGIAVETVLGNPGTPSPEFLAASPFRKMPAIVDGDFMLADSTAICTYFDALVPAPPMLPADPRARGRAVWFEEVADTLVAPAGGPVIYNRFLRPVLFGQPCNEEEAQAGLEKLAPILAYLESAAPETGWLAGEYSIADIAVACMIRTLAYGGVEVDAATQPRLAGFYQRVCARPAWQQVAAMEAGVIASLPAATIPA